MFSIEHEFDSTVITLVDEGTAQLQEDLIINSFSECVTIEQYDARTDKIKCIRGLKKKILSNNIRSSDRNSF